MECEVYWFSESETRRWGVRLGSLLQGGDIVLLEGDLGAGKTVLAKGIGEALRVTGEMTSPTFTMIQEYEGSSREQPVRVIHMDLYRLKRPEEAEVIGVYDFFADDCIIIIEWPGLIEEHIPREALRVILAGSGEEPRNVRFICREESWGKRLAEFLNKSKG